MKVTCCSHGSVNFTFDRPMLIEYVFFSCVELATKLSDLTTQAKMMLARNEEMETQLSEAQIEYEERLNELNAINEDLWNKLRSHNSDEVLSLREKYEDALEIIQQLKSDEFLAQRDQFNADSVDKFSESQLKRITEENIELRELVDHLVSMRLCFE